jgi:hypothetical protein
MMKLKKNLLAIAAAVICTGASAQSIQVSSFGVDGMHYHLTKNCAPGAALEYYSQRGGGKIVRTDAAGNVLVRFGSKLPAFVLVRNAKQDAGTVVFTEALDFELSGLKVTGENGSDNISWEASAQPSISFVLLASPDGKNYKTLAEFPAKPGPGVAAYTSHQKPAGNLFYKVAVKHAGKGALYQTAALSMTDGRANGAQVFPTAAKDFVHIRIPFTPGNNSYSIFNQQGQVALKGWLTNSTTAVNVAALPPGVYYVRVDAAGKFPAQRFVKL